MSGKGGFFRKPGKAFQGFKKDPINRINKDLSKLFGVKDENVAAGAVPVEEAGTVSVEEAVIARVEVALKLDISFQDRYLNGLPEDLKISVRELLQKVQDA